MSLLRLGYRKTGFRLSFSLSSLVLWEAICHAENCPMERHTKEWRPPTDSQRGPEDCRQPQLS